MIHARSTVAAMMVVGALAGGLVGVVGATSAQASGAKACFPAQINVTRGASQGTAGTSYVAIVFTNTRATSCTIFGVPVIQPVIGPAHHPLGTPARNLSMGEMPALHTLAKGRSVSVAFGVVDTGALTASACGARTARGVEVTLGAFAGPKYLAMPIKVCTKEASTTTRLVAPGTSGI